MKLINNNFDFLFFGCCYVEGDWLLVCMEIVLGLVFGIFVDSLVVVVFYVFFV